MGLNFFRKPALVRFSDGDDRCVGVAYGDAVICLCCGHVFEVEEVTDTIEIIPWLFAKEVQMLLVETEEEKNGTEFF